MSIRKRRDKLIVYKITNKINGKIYIGQTIHTLEYRLGQHQRNNSSNIGSAIIKYGIENFKAEVIAECNSVEEMDKLERYFIKKFKSIVPFGYNVHSEIEHRSINKQISLHNQEIIDNRYTFFHVMKLFSPKWKLPIIWYISESENGTLCYNELQRRVIGVTATMLSKSLKELEKDNIIKRKQYDTISPMVEYSLTEQGKSLLPAFNLLNQWAKIQMENHT